MLSITYYSTNIQEVIEAFYEMNKHTINRVFGSFDSYQDSIKPLTYPNMQTDDIRDITESIGPNLYIRELNEKIRLLKKQKSETFSPESIRNKTKKEVRQLLKQYEKQISELEKQLVSKYNFATKFLQHMAI